MDLQFSPLAARTDAITAAADVNGYTDPNIYIANVIESLQVDGGARKSRNLRESAVSDSEQGYRVISRVEDLPAVEFNREKSANDWKKWRGRRGSNPRPPT